METQIKKAVKAGNSSAVILPRSWLNKEVRVELVKKSSYQILSDVIDIIKDHIDTSEIIGIYLTGSYARNEEDEDSDIDILVITKDTDKKMIREGIYNILLVSLGLLKQKLVNDILPLGPMLKEAKPLINSNYIDSLDVKATSKNVKWSLKTTEEKLNILREALDDLRKKGEKKIENPVIYTLVLRIRTLAMIENLLKNKPYSKKEFVKEIRNISGSEKSYQAYLSVKIGLKKENYASIDEAEKLYSYLEKKLVEIRKLI